MKVKLLVDDVIQFEKEYSATVPPSMFICPTCGMVFTSQQLLDTHIAGIHPPILVGTFSAQVNRATKLDKKTWSESTLYGFYKDPITGNGSEIGIPASKISYFLVDPKTVIGTISRLKIQFTDFHQNDNLNINVIIIGRDDNIILPAIWGNPYGVPLSSNTHGPWVPRMGHKDEYRYLIEVNETKGQAIPYNIYWWGS